MRNPEQIPDRLPAVWGDRIPGRNKNFTGREALLTELRRSLKTSTRAAVLPQALHGQGGVGKTQLATEYVWRYRGAYDLVSWIPADQVDLLRGALAALAPRLGLPAGGVVGTEEAAASVREALQRGEPYASWLLVLDNADQPEDIVDFIPHGGPGHVLVTSRNNRWSGMADTVPVDVFTREESLAFLAKRLMRDVDPVDAGRLAEELGDLPLALEQAAALQLQSGISVDDYIEKLSAETGKLLKQGKGGEYPLSVTGAWQLSVQRVEDRVPEGAEMLRCCAFFGPDPIPRDVFRRGNKTPDIARMRPILSDTILLSRALGELGRFALVSVDSDAGTITVHRLIQALVRDSLDEAQHKEFRREVHLLLAESAPGDPEDTGKWRRFADLVPHVGPSRLATSEDPRVRAFAVNVVRYLYHIGNYQLAKTFAEDFQDKWTTASGHRDPDVLRLRRHLGNVLWQLGEYEASRTTNEVTLALMREVFGPEHEETLRVTNSYGGNLRAAGEFLAAREYDAQSRLAHERVMEENSPATLRVINSLALDHVLLSDHKTGRRLHELAYLLQSSAGTGVGRRDVLDSWNSLARVVRLSGDYSAACDLGEEAYSFGRRELGVEHPVSVLTAKDLSIARRRAGDTQGALELSLEAYERAEKLFGGDNPLTMSAAVALANTLRRAGDLAGSFAHTRDTASRYERVYGPDHPFTHGCLANLALLYRHRGDASRARELNERAWAGLMARLGEEHEYSFTAAINLAGDLAALGDADAACELGERVLERSRSFFGEDHFLTLSAAVNLVIDRRAQGADAEADALHRDTFARYERTLQPDNPDRIQAQSGTRIDWDFDPPLI
ncbi:FxSxx-COOH system tetratricopeptide repeat protein [Sphaerisporangium dianthi]|uniref:FxSxx-COOH system tetratricopeptide repeat protein n=1 Tax=Sphaerisporangium dianthi TaxID=1436120 RepID=A0ABV9CM00_9ACTN